MAKRRARGAGSLAKSKHRDLWIGTATIGGQKYRVYAKLKRDAQKKLNVLLVNGPPAKDQPTLTVGALLTEWLATDMAAKNHAPSTEARHRWAADLLTTWLGRVVVADLSTGDVEDAFVAMLPMSTASLRQVRSTLIQALNRDIRRSQNSRQNVARAAELPAGSTAATTRKSLSSTDARTLLDVLEDKRNGAMFSMMLRLGLRPGEAAGLFWDSLDLEAGVVTISRGVRSDHGRAYVVDELKTTSAHRSLALPADLVAALKSHCVAQKVERLAATSWGDDRLVFATRSGTVIGSRNMRRELVAICSDAEIESVTPNELRHTFSSFLSDRGVAHEKIADALGHVSVRMLDAHYRHRLRPVIDVAASVDWSAETASD